MFAKRLHYEKDQPSLAIDISARYSLSKVVMIPLYHFAC